MPESGKILYIKKNDVTESAKTYTLPSDLIAGKPYLGLDIAGQVCYVQLDNVGAANATSGRVLKNGVEYQICSTGYKPVNYHRSYGATTGWADNVWDNLTYETFVCPSIRTVPTTFHANWYNANSTSTNESHIRLLVHGEAVITWLDYTGNVTKSKSTTVNVTLPAGIISVAIQYFKPKWTRWELSSATVTIVG